MFARRNWTPRNCRCTVSDQPHHRRSRARDGLRVGFFIDRFDVGGSELNAVKVAESLAALGVHLTVFHLSADGALRERYQRAGIDLIHTPVQGLLSASAWQVMRTVRREARARGIELLHAHCVYTNILGAGAASLPGRSLPLLVSRRWTGSLPRRSLGVLNRVAQSVGTGVLVNSPSLLRVVQRESPFAKPIYVPNILRDHSYVSLSPEERAERRRRLGVLGNGPVVGCVARLAPVKDHATLFAAWRLVIEAIPDAQLIVIGDGPLRSTLLEWAAESAMRGSIHVVGELAPESLPHALLDVSVLSSLDEGFPNSLLEAMAQGVVVVSTRVGGVPDLVQDRKNGMLVGARTPAQLASAICDVLASRVDVDGMRAMGRVTAEQHREANVMADLLSLYERLRGVS